MLMSNEEIATLKGYLKNRVAYARYSKIEFYNVDGGIFASGTESINKESFSEGILYRYTIAIKQTTE